VPDHEVDVSVQVRHRCGEALVFRVADGPGFREESSPVVEIDQVRCPVVGEDDVQVAVAIDVGERDGRGFILAKSERGATGRSWLSRGSRSVRPSGLERYTRRALPRGKSVARLPEPHHHLPQGPVSTIRMI
jgi:hypothetical protein